MGKRGKYFQIDDGLMKTAKEYADELARDVRIGHSKPGRFKGTGENLALGCTTHPAIQDYYGKPDYIVFAW